MPLASAAFAFLSRGVREFDRTRGEEGVGALNMKLEIHNCRVIRHQKNTWTSFASFACEMVAHHSKLLMRLNRLRLFWEFRMGFIFVFRSLFFNIFWVCESHCMMIFRLLHNPSTQSAQGQANEPYRIFAGPSLEESCYMPYTHTIKLQSHVVCGAIFRV